MPPIWINSLFNEETRRSFDLRFLHAIGEMMVNLVKDFSGYEKTGFALCIALFSLVFLSGCSGLNGDRNGLENQYHCVCPLAGSLEDFFPIIHPSQLIEFEIDLYEPGNRQKQNTLRNFFIDLELIIESEPTIVNFSYHFIPDRRKFLVKASNREWDIDWVGEYSIVSSDWIDSSWGKVTVYNEYVYSINYIGSRRTDGVQARNEIRNRVERAMGHLADQQKYRERMIFRSPKQAGY